MKRRIFAALFAIGGLATAIACGPNQSDTGCTDTGNTCVTPGDGLTCLETMPYGCVENGAVCCSVRPPGSGSSSGSSSSSSGGSSGSGSGGTSDAGSKG
jgi:hypothetical protein